MAIYPEIISYGGETIATTHNTKHSVWALSGSRCRSSSDAVNSFSAIDLTGNVIMPVEYHPVMWYAGRPGRILGKLARRLPKLALVCLNANRLLT